MDNLKGVNDAVTYMETNYPEMSNEYKRIIHEQYEMFCRKNKNYGVGNIALGTDLKSDKDKRLSLMGIWFRISDKINRLRQLIIFNDKDEVGESSVDTFQDLSNYSIIAQIVINGKWGK
jgi:hypothetical protein